MDERCVNDIENWKTSACQIGRYAVIDDGRRPRFSECTRACTFSTSNKGTGPEECGKEAVLDIG